MLSEFSRLVLLGDVVRVSRSGPSRCQCIRGAVIIAVSALILLAHLFSDAARADTVDQSKGVLWVFAVGVSQYKNSRIDLQFADNDAQTLAATLGDRGSGVFTKVHAKVLVNSEVTRRSIVDGVVSFFAPAQPADTGIIALMGHGVNANGTFYYVPYPADLTNLDTEGLPVAELEEAVHQVSARLRRTVLVVDTCHAAELNFRVRDLGALAQREQRARGISLVSAIAPAMPETYILSSSEGSESSWEDSSYRLPGEPKGHGAFTYALLRGLDGDAAHNGVVNILDLFSYASEEVPIITANKQHPYVHGQGTNFEIAKSSDISPQDRQQAAVLTQQGYAAKQQGKLQDAQAALARAGTLNPRNQVSSVLHDEVSADIAYHSDPQAQQDVIEQTAALLRKSGNTGPTDLWTPHPLVLAFLDFSTLGNSPELAGLHAALVARITQSLQGTKRVSIVDRHLLDQVLREMRLSMSDLSDSDTRLKLGHILVARLIATGNVVFLGPSKYLVNLEIIDTETTEVKANLSQAGEGAEQILPVADKVQHDIINELQIDYPLRGKIVAVDGDLVILNIGSQQGATVGTRMNAVAEEPIKVNGEVVANRLKTLGAIEVTAVHEKVSFAKMTDHRTSPPAGTKVIQSLTVASKS
jgi:uncharacterized caspase-like protein